MISARTGIRAVQVGIFSLIAISGMVFAYLWINNFRLKPEYSFYVSFKEPKYIHVGTEVIYRGIPVGTVSKIKFSKDFENTILKLDINEKNLKLNKNIRVLIQELNFVGKKTVTLLAAKEASTELIQNGDQIKGIDSPGFVEMQMYTNKLLVNIDSIFKNNEISESYSDVNELINHYKCIAEKFDYVLEQDRPAMKMFFGAPLKDFNCKL